MREGQGKGSSASWINGLRQPGDVFDYNGSVQPSTSSISSRWSSGNTYPNASERAAATSAQGG
jgi:hypothetical protein